MSTGVEIVCSAMDAGATSVFQQITAAQGGMEHGVKKSTDAYKYLHLSIDRLYKETRTPQERHAQRLQAINNLLDGGKKNQDLYNRAVRQSEDAMRGAEAAHESAFGPKALQMVTGLAGAFGVGAGLAGAIMLVKSAAEGAKAEIDAVVEKTKSARDELRNLWQVSGSAKEYTQLSGQMKLGMAKEGIDRDRAAQLVFKLKSAGRMDAIAGIVGAEKFMPAEVAAAAFTTLTSPVNYGPGLGTPEQILSGLKVSADNSKFNVADTAEMITRVAPTLKASGASVPEILGLLSAISPSAANPEMLSTRMLALDKGLSRWAAESVKGDKFKAGKFTPQQVGTGILGRWQAMTTLDPEAYAKLKLEDSEFNRASTPLEGPGVVLNARTNERLVAEAMRTGLPYQEKRRTPLELTRLQQANVAELQKEVALEERANKVVELRTRGEQGKTLAGLFDTNLGVEKVVESAMEAGATYGMIDKANELATERTAEIIRQKRPEVFARHLAGEFPIGRPRAYGTVPGGPGGVMPGVVDIPGPATQSQNDALARALAELSETAIVQRQAAAEQIEAAKETKAAVGRLGQRPNPGTLRQPGGDGGK